MKIALYESVSKIQRGESSGGIYKEERRKQMKKIMITVLAVLATASMAKAGVPQINFDGIGTPVDVRAILRENPEFEVVVPEARPQQEEFFSRLNEGVITGVIQGAIESCAAEGKGAVMVNLKNLLKYGTMKEKETFVYNKRAIYSFPAGIISRRFDTGGGEGSGSKSRDSLNLTCNSWTTVKVCTNRQVCRIACSAAAAAAGAWAGGNIGAAAAIGASGQICKELCENVEECSNVRECDSWSSTAGTGTDAHGNYRGRAVAFQN